MKQNDSLGVPKQCQMMASEFIKNGTFGVPYDREKQQNN
jgi:hypothetical protein